MKEIGQLVLSKSDTELNRIQKIIEFHEEIKNLMINSLEKAFTIGFLLGEQKEGMPHGEFIPWIEKNLPFGERTARNYRMVYKNREMLNRKAVSDLNSAYIILKERKRTEKDERRKKLREEMAYKGEHLLDGIAKEYPRVKVEYVKTNSGFTLKKTLEEKEYGGGTVGVLWSEECIETEGIEANKNKAPYDLIDYFDNTIMDLRRIKKESKKIYEKYGDAIFESYSFNWNDGKKYLYPELEKAFKELKVILDQIIKSKTFKKG